MKRHEVGHVPCGTAIRRRPWSANPCATPQEVSGVRTGPTKHRGIAKLIYRDTAAIGVRIRLLVLLIVSLLLVVKRLKVPQAGPEKAANSQ